MSATAEAPAQNGQGDERARLEAEGWKFSEKQSRFFTGRRGGTPGIVYRQGNETVDEALARDAKNLAKDKKPAKAKSSAAAKVPKAPAPQEISLQEIEFRLVEVLKAPEMIAGLTGDEWAAEHFERQAPVLARNLVNAAKTSPWLRQKLELLGRGDELMMIKVMTFLPVISAAIAYVMPPLIYYFNPPFIAAGAREMFAVPYRDQVQAEKAQEKARMDAQAAQAAQAAAREAADAAAAAGAPASS